MLKLYHNDMSVCAQKVRLALAEKELQYEGQHLNLRAGDQRDPAYLKLNPKAVVPTLVHDDKVITESVVINEYLEDAFPEKLPLRPLDPLGRAMVRLWTKEIDGGIFGATATVSVSIAFHHQYTPELIAKMAELRGPAYLARIEQFKKGVDNPAFPEAIRRMDKMLADMDKALAGGRWLLGADYTLADVAYAPYVTRLDHLKFLDQMLENRGRVADWYARIRERPAYRTAMAAWFNPKYLPLMEEKGNEAWPRVRKLLLA